MKQFSIQRTNKQYKKEGLILNKLNLLFFCYSLLSPGIK